MSIKYVNGIRVLSYVEYLSLEPNKLYRIDLHAAPPPGKHVLLWDERLGDWVGVKINEPERRTDVLFWWSGDSLRRVKPSDMYMVFPDFATVKARFDLDNPKA